MLPRAAFAQLNIYGYFHETAVDPLGNVFMTGATSDGIYILKYDASGSLVWACPIGPNGCAGAGYEVIVDPSGSAVFDGTRK